MPQLAPHTAGGKSSVAPRLPFLVDLLEDPRPGTVAATCREVFKGIVCEALWATSSWSTPSTGSAGPCATPLNLIHDLAARGVGIRNLADPIKVNSSSPADPMAQLAVVLLALFAQMERTYSL